MATELSAGTPAISPGQIWHDNNFQTLIHVDSFQDGQVKYSQILNFDISTLRHYGTSNETQFLKQYKRLLLPLSEALEIGEKIAAGEMPYTAAFEAPEAYESNSALVSVDTKKTLVAKVQQLEQTQAGLENLRACFMLSMERKKQELDLIRREMDAQLSQIHKMVARIMRVIQSIELYLGVQEEMVQFQGGEPAAQDEQIVFRQLVLYMDEEVANTKDGGMDINSLEDFEAWLRVPENLAQVMPDKKGMVAFKPRRYRKEYGDAWLDACMAKENNKTFFLIRNGDNLTHVFTANLQCEKRMFPGMSGMAEMQERAKSNWHSDKEKVKDEIQDQARLALFFQGLIDRSDVFKPHAPGISIFEEGGAPHIRFLYDAEDLLPDGRKRFREWREEINSSIQRGSRVIVAGAPGWQRYGGNRWARYYGEYSAPMPPMSGLYSVEKDNFEGKERLFILYNPKDNVWTWTSYGERKNRLSYEIRVDDDFILHYDRMDLADIDFYLQNRIDRPNYLSMMPLLRELKERRLKEMFAETEFCKAMAFECGVSEEAVFQAVDWWKMKVIMKRPLDKDDAKAWRMIRSKLLREK